jgi:hypothetical protein
MVQGGGPRSGGARGGHLGAARPTGVGAEVDQVERSLCHCKRIENTSKNRKEQSRTADE